MDNQDSEIVNPFTDVPYTPLPQPVNQTQQVFSDVQTLNVGNGNTVLRADKSGLWLGAERFIDAPFSVDMLGNAIVNSLTAAGYIPEGEAASDVNANATKVNAGKINAVTLSAIVALLGSVDVGGSANGNGVLNVKDASGNIKVVLDNAGITINDGKLVIKDATAQTIIDATGLVSGASFANAAYSDNSTISTTSNSFADVSGSSLTFSLARSANVLIGFAAVGRFNGVADAINIYGVQLAMNLDGSDQSPIGECSAENDAGSTNFVGRGTLSASKVFSLGSGSHTIKLRWRGLQSGSTVNLLNKNLYYIVLGT